MRRNFIQPKNIAELTAFVAAIRPGFASLYKKFENREHFSFGIKSLDDMLQTPEMQESWLLYQESIMAVLNYSGIPMSECYTAIKNIAKKRAEKVLAYQQKFREGMRTRLSSEGYGEEKIKETCDLVWQTIEDAASYSYNASHAYCVALDSLYCAWFKAHHPLKFYEQYLRIQEEKGDKDKMNALKEEAESYFGIKFPPLRFGQDNRQIRADESNNSITNSIASIKGFSSGVGTILYECGNRGFSSFVDVLSWLDKNSMKAAKIKPLILINYFSQFGNENELMEILNFWEFMKQGNAKLVKKDKIDSPVIKEIFEKNCSATKKDGGDSSSYRIDGRAMQCLYEYEQYIKQNSLKEPSMRQRIQWSNEILGYTDVATGKECDRKRLVITDVTTLNDTNGNIWSYRVGTRSLGSGKTARLTIKKDIFEKKRLQQGDIIYAAELFKNKTGYWYLLSYDKE